MNSIRCHRIVRRLALVALALTVFVAPAAAQSPPGASLDYVGWDPNSSPTQFHFTVAVSATDDVVTAMTLASGANTWSSTTGPNLLHVYNGQTNLNSDGGSFSDPVSGTNTYDVYGDSAEPTAGDTYTITVDLRNGGSVVATTTIPAPPPPVTPGAPTLTLTAGQSSFVDGSTVWYQGGNGSGDFTVSAQPPEGEQAASFQYPDLGDGWSGDGKGGYAFASGASEPGTQQVTYQDALGNTSDPAAFDVREDATAPVTAISCNGGSCDGWFHGAVSVTLSAADTDSGVAETRYTTDGSDPTSSDTAQTYDGAFTVSSTTTVDFASTDNVGNTEPVASAAIQIDATPPQVSMTSPSDGDSVNGVVQLAASASDEEGGSGLATTTFQLSSDGELWSDVPANWDTTMYRNGSYQLRAVATDVAGNVTDSDPVSVTVDNPLPTLSIADGTITEPANGDSVNLDFTVTLSDASHFPVTVDFATADDTAQAPGDYTATSGTLTFSPGDTTGTISVPVLGDTIDEQTEDFHLTLSNADGADIANGTATGTIIDNPYGTGPHAIAYSPGCKTNSLGRNDDGYSGAVALPFAAHFFNATYSSIYVNNNGDVTFDGPLSDYTPFDLTSTSHVIIAPFFADVDTRGAGSDVVTYGNTTFDGHDAFCVLWAGAGVGYYDENTDKLNDFQLLLVDRSDVAAGDFDIVFDYDQIQWETGDASNGSDGLGGYSARAGYSNGSDSSLELPGSAQNGAFLDSNPNGLVHGSLNSGGQLGRYVFAVRSGAPPLPPTVTTQPADASGPAGSTVHFTAASNGSPAPTVQWQVSTNGSDWSDLAGATSADLALTVDRSLDGNRYRAVFTNASGTTQSDPAQLTVTNAPNVTTQPQSQTAASGATVTFTAAAGGTPTPTVQWQVSTGGSYTAIAGATSGSLSVVASASTNGNRYRAVFTNDAGSATSDAATLTLQAASVAPSVTGQPTATTVVAGRPASFSAAASGTPTPTVQWQVSFDGGNSFSSLSGQTSTTLRLTPGPADDGNRYRAVFTNAAGSATTNAARLTVQTAPIVATQPQDETIGVGLAVRFTADAIGSPDPTVQWQRSADGVAFANIPGATGRVLTFVTSGSDDRSYVRAVFTNAAGTATTRAGRLTVITTPPTTPGSTVAVQNVTPTGADLSVSESASPSLLVRGSGTTFTITVTNNGPDPATGVSVSASLGTGLDLASASGCSTGLTCSIGSLAVGASASVSISATASGTGALVGSASVGGNEPDPDPGNNGASATVGAVLPPQIQPPTTPPPPPVLPPPVPGSLVNAQPVTGYVFVDGAPLVLANQIHVGATVDVRGGSIQLVTQTDSAVFSGGVFKITQPANPAAPTDLVMQDQHLDACKTTAGATTARIPGRGHVRGKGRAAMMVEKPKILAELWGSGHGHFTTRGRYSSATVRGTIWLSADRCDGTFTYVKSGEVAIYDQTKKKTIILTAGHSYLAKPPTG